MNDAVEMTTNQFQQNISIKLADEYLSTLLARNFMKFPVDLTKIFNSVDSIEIYLQEHIRLFCSYLLKRDILAFNLLKYVRLNKDSV